MLTHWYHVYADGEWREPVAEHMWALDRSRFTGQLHLGVVGHPDRRAQAIDQIAGLHPVASIVEADSGHEQVTLRALHQHAHRQPRGAILYAHTKGAAHPSRYHNDWRASMTHHLVLGHQQAYRAIIDHRYDTVGCHYISEQIGPHFAGNYWMASIRYLRRLPECADTSRWDAEAWIGLAQPRVLDLLPGPPGVLTGHRIGRLYHGPPPA